MKNIIFRLINFVQVMTLFCNYQIFLVVNIMSKIVERLPVKV